MLLSSLLLEAAEFGDFRKKPVIGFSLREQNWVTGGWKEHFIAPNSYSPSFVMELGGSIKLTLMGSMNGPGFIFALSWLIPRSDFSLLFHVKFSGVTWWHSEETEGGTGALEGNHWVKHSLGELEDPSLDPLHPCKGQACQCMHWGDRIAGTW